MALRPSTLSTTHRLMRSFASSAPQGTNLSDFLFVIVIWIERAQSFCTVRTGLVLFLFIAYRLFTTTTALGLFFLDWIF